MQKILIEQFVMQDGEDPAVSYSMLETGNNHSCVGLCLDLIYNSIKYHEDILKTVYGLMDAQRHVIIRLFFLKKGRIKMTYFDEQRAITREALCLSFVKFHLKLEKRP